MADTSGWITLKGVVESVLYEGGFDLSLYKKFMHFAITGMRDLNQFYVDNVRTTKVTMNDLGIISLPSDYINIVSLAVDHEGKFWPLTRRDDIIRTTTEEGGDEVQDSDIGEGVELETEEYHGYGLLGGYNDYYYTIDERAARIIVNGSPTRTLFLQYISSGVDLDSGNQTYVPVKALEALKAWIFYKYFLRDQNSDKRLLDTYKREYWYECSKLKFADLPTAHELKDMIYETYGVLMR